MPTPKTPRSGSMQYWPRKRAKRAYPTIKKWTLPREGTLLGFPGYKAGMTHISFTDNIKNSLTAGDEITVPVTIIECPPIKIAGVRFYKGKLASTEVWIAKDKELNRKVSVPKNPKKLEDIKLEGYDDLSLLIFTQPKLTGLKKKPEIFEIPLKGTLEEKFAFANEHAAKELTIDQVFSEGQFLDMHAITKGKGFQGPVKRFGIDLKRKKSEKGQREPGAIGAWSTRWHMYRVPHAGQMGFHQRLDMNKKLLKISKEIETANPDGGFVKYGVLKNPFVLIHGSVSGPRKRLIVMTHAMRKVNEKPEPIDISYISKRSKQGR